MLSGKTEVKMCEIVSKIMNAVGWDIEQCKICGNIVASENCNQSIKKY